jgi:hypothetical protein
MPMPMQFAPPPRFPNPPAVRRQQAPPFQARPALPSPVFRGQSPEEPAPAPRGPAPRPMPLTLPSPEALGVTSARPAGDDPVHRRLDQLGATCLHLEKLPQGGYRVSCLLPTSQADRSHRIDAQAETATEAVRLAVERAEAWSARK